MDLLIVSRYYLLNGAKIKMSFPTNTQTTKEILRNDEAIELVERLEKSIKFNKVQFIQAIYEVATPALIDELEVILSISQHLYSNIISEEELKIMEYIKTTIPYEHKRKDSSSYYRSLNRG